MNCININSLEYKQLLKDSGFKPEILKAKISLWQDVNGFDSFPTLKDLGINPSTVNAALKSLDILTSDKAEKLFKTLEKNKVANNIFWTKVQQDLAIPKEQIEILKSFDTKDKNQLITDLLANYSYTIEINTAKKTIGVLGADRSSLNFNIENSNYSSFKHAYLDEFVFTKNGKKITKEEYDTAREAFQKKYDKSLGTKNTNYYSNLTVPGGTNYTEQEIATPAITPSIKGHAQFATDNGIGWFRSDDKLDNAKTAFDLGADEYIEDDFGRRINPKNYTLAETGTPTKTRRILEVQSDLFQKGRESKILTRETPPLNIEDIVFRYEQGEEITSEEKTIAEDYLSKETSKRNEFLQLLNKDNNWVTFFVKSIIQDSAKKGYEKVLFPTGNTASKVEGHTTLEEFKKQKEDRIKALEDEKSKIKEEQYFVDTLDDVIEFQSYEEAKNFSDQDFSRTLRKVKGRKVEIDNEINQLKQELERVETEGFGALKPIYNFYENTVSNILKKQGFNPVLVTDEYGNTWNEVNLKESDLNPIYFQLSNLTPEQKLAQKWNIQSSGFSNIKGGIPTQLITDAKKLGLGVKLSSGKNFYLTKNDKFYNPWKFSYQKESKGTPNEALDNIIKIFLSKANFNVEEVFDEIKTQTGEDATASVDLFNRLIKISKNKQGEDTLTEEAAHVLETMLGKDHPLYQKMFDLIEQTEVWESTLSEYNTVYDGNLDKIKFEAIGKMITKVAIQKFKKNELNTTSNTVWDKFSKLVQAAFKWLNNKFKNVPDTFESEIEKVYGEAADMLLTGNVPQGEITSTETFFQLDSDKKKYGDFIVDKGFPIQVSNLEKIQFGKKRLSVRPNLYADGVYKLGNYFYQIRKIKPNKALYSEFKSGNFLKEKAFGSEEIKYQHIKDFFDNKTPMYVYSIMKLDSDIQMLYQAEEVKKKKAVYKDAIQEQIERSEIKITRIKRKAGYLENPTDLANISKLEEYIKNLKEQRALKLIEEKATNELNAIEQRLNENFENVADKKGFFTYALETLKGWQDLNQFITYPEDKEGKQRIINLVGKAKDLEDIFWKKYKDFGGEKYGEDFNSSIIDESFFGANFLDIAQSKIPILKKIGEFINKARFTAYELTKQLETKTNEEFELLKKWSGYKSDKELWDLFRQKDSKGNWTGNYVAEISNSFYEKKAELAKWAKENKSFSAYYRWLNANTDKVFNKEAFDAMYEQVKATEFTLPDGSIDEAGLQAWVKANNENSNKSPFITYTPKVELWKDKQYEYIQSVPELKRFYDFFINTLKERESVLPAYERKQSNYLPELRRNILLDFSKNGMTSLFNQFKDSFANDIESSKETVLRDPITGEPEKTIPVYMMADRLKPEDKEYDLTKVLKSFGAMSYMYEQKNAIEEPVKLMSSLFRNLKEKLVAEGTDKTDRFGKLVEILDGNKQAVTMMDYHIDAMLYDKTREDDTTKKLGEITVDGETKKVTAGSIIDWLINYTRIKGLAGNIFSGVTNSTFGISANFIHAEGKVDFNPTQAMDALGIMLNAVIKGSDTNKKVNFLMDKFRIKPEAVSSEGANISKYLYAFTEAGEYINYGQTGIATLLNTKVKNLKGETKDLYDAYIIQNGKVVWNTKEFGPEQYTDLSEEKYNLATKIQGLNKRIHGNYDPESPIKIKSHVWGRAVMIFRSWLPMAIYTRFGSVNMSKELGRETKGRYITGLEYAKQNKFGALLPVFKELMTQVINTSTLNRLQLESGAFNELSELDKENMLRNVAELRYILFFMLLGTLLKGMTIDDEDEEKVALTKFIINQTDRVEGELSFFFSPYDQSRIIRDISPVSRTFKDFYDLVPATTRLITGEDELKSGPNKGDSNFYRQLKQAVPIITQIQKAKELKDLNVDNPMVR